MSFVLETVLWQCMGLFSLVKLEKIIGLVCKKLRIWGVHSRTTLARSKSEVPNCRMTMVCSFVCVYVCVFVCLCVCAYMLAQRLACLNAALQNMPTLVMYMYAYLRHGLNDPLDSSSSSDARLEILCTK